MLAPWDNGNIERYAGSAEVARAFFAQHTVELGAGHFALVGAAARLRGLIDREVVGIAESADAEQWQLPGGASSSEPSETAGHGVCHSVYRVLRDARASEDVAGRTITVHGSSEQFSFAPQYKASMREVLLLGDAAYIAEQRERLLRSTKILIQMLDLAAHVESSDAAPTFDVVLSLDRTTRVVAASFDLRHTSSTETACVGFGLERWMAAAVARWGGSEF